MKQLSNPTLNKPFTSSAVALGASNQTTLAQPIAFEGIGLHTGLQIQLKVLPAPEGTGYCFVRTDLPDQPQVPALADFVVCTERSTTIQLGSAKVSTIEHLLAALYWAEIDNARIEINGPEVPIMDGSAFPFFEGIEKAGRSLQNLPRKTLSPKQLLEVETLDNRGWIRWKPAQGFSVEAEIDFNSKVLPSSKVRFQLGQAFGKELAPARTFVFLHELHWLMEQGLVKGGNLENALVFIEEKPQNGILEALASFFGQTHLKINGKPILNDTPLRFPDEAARHKLLDILGDIALSGFRLQGHLEARCPGHNLNVAFAKKIREIYAHE